MVLNTLTPQTACGVRLDRSIPVPTVMEPMATETLTINGTVSWWNHASSLKTCFIKLYDKKQKFVTISLSSNHSITAGLCFAKIHYQIGFSWYCSWWCFHRSMQWNLLWAISTVWEGNSSHSRILCKCCQRRRAVLIFPLLRPVVDVSLWQQWYPITESTGCWAGF